LVAGTSGRRRDPQQLVEWIRRAAALLTLCCMGGQFLTRSWFHGVLPPTIGTIAHLVIAWSRLLFVALTALICSRALRDRRDAPLGISALLLVSIGLFAQEISELGVKGIWFPFGTGVSRTQFAYAAFDLLAFALLWNRLGRFARLSAPEQ